jgi:hypothetical protein
VAPELVCAVAGVSAVALSSRASSGPAPTAPRVADANSVPATPLSGPSKMRAAQPTGSGGSASRSASGHGISSGGIVNGAPRWPNSLESQIQGWIAGSGGAAWSAVTAQLGNATQAAGVRLYPRLKQACVALGSSVQTAQAAPPIPYAAMQRLYAKVLAGLSGATADCRTAISIRLEGDEEMRIDLNKPS